MLNIINSKLQIKTAMKYHYTSTNMAKKTPKNPNVKIMWSNWRGVNCKEIMELSFSQRFLHILIEVVVEQVQTFVKIH